MGNYFSANKIAVENATESIQTSIVKEVAQSEPTPEVETQPSVEVVEDPSKNLVLVEKDVSDNLVHLQTITNFNEVTGIECEASQTTEEKDEIIVAEESMDAENKEEEPANKPNQLELPTKKQKKKKQKTY